MAARLPGKSRQDNPPWQSHKMNISGSIPRHVGAGAIRRPFHRHPMHPTEPLPNATIDAASPTLVEVWRATVVESSHRGALAIVDADGTVVLALGDTRRPVYPRSAIKLLQALPLVESGAADAFGLDDDALALACASHNGEPVHAATAAAVLARAGADERWLECGVQAPRREADLGELLRAGRRPGPLHHNCSGKHAGFICVACHLADASGRERAAATRAYVEAGHPVMREVAAAIGAVTGVPIDRAPVAIDGCSVPTWALPLQAVALGFARVATGQGLPPVRRAAVERLRRAVASRPHLVAGTDRFDTRVMALLGARAFVKVGAEGVHVAALPSRGWGIAIKIDDGNTRASEVVMAAVLQAALESPDDTATGLEALAAPRLVNARGREVGGIEPAPALRAALAALR